MCSLLTVLYIHNVCMYCIDMYILYVNGVLPFRVGGWGSRGAFEHNDSFQIPVGQMGCIWGGCSPIWSSANHPHLSFSFSFSHAPPRPSLSLLPLSPSITPIKLPMRQFGKLIENYGYGISKSNRLHRTWLGPISAPRMCNCGLRLDEISSESCTKTGWRGAL